MRAKTMNKIAGTRALTADGAGGYAIVRAGAIASYVTGSGTATASALPAGGFMTTNLDVVPTTESIDALPAYLALRKRADAALAGTNLREVTVDGVTTTLECEIYDYSPTHWNLPALEELTAELRRHAQGLSSDAAIRERIKAVRDTSTITFVDFAIRTVEPCRADYRRAALLCGFADDPRLLVPKYWDERARLRYLLAKTAAVYQLHLEQRELERPDGRTRSSVYGDPLTKLQMQLRMLLGQARRVLTGEPLDELAMRLAHEHGNTEFTDRANVVTRPLATYDVDDVVLHKDIFTADSEQLPPGTVVTVTVGDRVDAFTTFCEQSRRELQEQVNESLKAAPLVVGDGRPSPTTANTSFLGSVAHSLADVSMSFEVVPVEGGFTPQDDETREMFAEACARISDVPAVQEAQLAKDEAELAEPVVPKIATSLEDLL